MIRSIALAAVSAAFFSPIASAKDFAVVLNEQERAQLVHALDVATRADGLNIAESTAALFNKIKLAPEVVPHKDGPVKDPQNKADEKPGAAP